MFPVVFLLWHYVLIENVFNQVCELKRDVCTDPLHQNALEDGFLTCLELFARKCVCL